MQNAGGKNKEVSGANGFQKGERLFCRGCNKAETFLSGLFSKKKKKIA
jgi:hypothetical protein